MANDTAPGFFGKIAIYLLDVVWLASLALLGVAFWLHFPGFGRPLVIVVIIALVILVTLRFFPRIGNYFAVLIVAATWAALLWYFTPTESIKTKSIASLTLNDLSGIAFWFFVLLIGGRMLLALLQDDPRR